MKLVLKGTKNYSGEKPGDLTDLLISIIKRSD
jgi:hypothetical protein